MNNECKAEKPFQFCTRLNLSEATGLRAANIEQLLRLIKEVPGSCIYHHTHRFLQRHEYLSPEPPNDFAYWITGELGEDILGEKLASIDIIQFESIRALREKITAIIESHMASNYGALVKLSRPGREFCFLKSISFIAPTHYVATDLKSFADGLEKVTLNSIYFHVFEARLRLENKTNDFSNWLETSLGNTELAGEINRLDPYTYALADLRKTVAGIVRRSCPK